MQDKQVAITGVSGFIGSALASYLARHGASVVGIDIKPANPMLDKAVKFVEHDALDQQFLEEQFKGIDVVFHMAAVYGGSKYIFDNGASILDYNCRLYSSVFTAAQRAHIGRLIFPSSGLAYNQLITSPVVETDMDAYPPTKNAYGFMKLVGENYCTNYWQQYKLPYTIVRMFNVYGPGDIHEHVVPLFAKKAIAKQAFQITGDGSDTRVFTHITDIVEALSMLAFSPKAQNEIYNLSNEEEIKLVDLAKLLWTLANPGEEAKIEFVPSVGSTPSRRAVNCSKIKTGFNWSAKMPFSTGLREVIEWTKTLPK